MGKIIATGVAGVVFGVGVVIVLGRYAHAPWIVAAIGGMVSCFALVVVLNMDEE